MEDRQQCLRLNERAFEFLGDKKGDIRVAYDRSFFQDLNGVWHPHYRYKLPGGKIYRTSLHQVHYDDLGDWEVLVLKADDGDWILIGSLWSQDELRQLLANSRRRGGI